MKKNITLCEQFQKSNRKFVERGKIDFIVKFIGNVLHNSYEGYSRFAIVESICFYPNFLISFNILLESKDESQTIGVTCLLYDMLFSHLDMTHY